MSFKAIELDAQTRQRTGREFTLTADTRQAAIDQLLEHLAVTADQARVDPTRTLVRVADRLWTLVIVRSSVMPGADAPSVRRGGAKHKHVR
jgi:hypothetical protein